MKAGNFNFEEYLNNLCEEAEANTTKGYAATSDKDGIILPEDTKKNFDWLNKEYQKGKVEVKVEVKGEGSSFKPGYDLQTDLKSVKDFKPGMYGEIKTSDSKTEEPKSPKNKKEETPAEEKEPKGDNEAAEPKQAKTKSKPEDQKIKVDTSKTKNKDVKK